MRSRVLLAIGCAAVMLGIVAWASKVVRLAPQPPHELRFLYELDRNPTLKDFQVVVYGARGAEAGYPALVFDSRVSKQAVAHRLKQLRSDGWRVNFPEVGSFSGTCDKGPQHLLFYANYPQPFLVYYDSGVQQPAWRMWLYRLTN